LIFIILTETLNQNHIIMLLTLLQV